MLYTIIQTEGNNGTSKAERNMQVSVYTGQTMPERHKQILEIYGLHQSWLSFSKFQAGNSTDVSDKSTRV